MSRRLFVGVFEREDDTLAAVQASRRLGFKVADVYAPYAVHGLEEAMGLPPSRLPWIVFLLGLSGAAFKVWFEFWTTMVDWPLNVGGKPFNSLPAFVPVTFEVMVLCAALGAVISLFFICRLLPGKRAIAPVAGVTDNRFAVVLEEVDSTFDTSKVQRMFEDFHAVHVEEQIEEAR
ncbi:MAG TPA: DUF3341 domain-containing protein [Terriglobales bacterium]|nr:DUF3341 domain-containing protein [Terriglobales bacterium]